MNGKGEYMNFRDFLRKGEVQEPIQNQDEEIQDDTEENDEEE